MLESRSSKLGIATYHTSVISVLRSLSQKESKLRAHLGSPVRPGGEEGKAGREEGVSSHISVAQHFGGLKIL